jgi:putative transposase
VLDHSRRVGHAKQVIELYGGKAVEELSGVLGRESGARISPSFVRQPECNGCVERFIRTLKEQLLWVRVFQNVEELRGALAEFRERYNQWWIVQRLGYLTPARARRQLRALGAAA